MGDEVGDGDEVAAWNDPDVVARYDHTDGWTDAGEHAAVAAVRPWTARRVLDLGVGGGRTTGLLAAGADSYTGYDVAPDMVELARDRFPGVTLRTGDARDLGREADGSADLVVFSFNGLDSLDRPGRAAALAEMARVVAPDGRVLFSSLNRDGPSFGEGPFRVSGGPFGPRARTVLRASLRRPLGQVRAVRHHRTTRRQVEDGGPDAGWARVPMRAHEFRFVVHFSTLAQLVADVAAAGLEPLAGWADDGRVLDLAAPSTDADYVHVVCRPAG